MKIRYAWLLLTGALVSLIGNTLLILSSPIKTVAMMVGTAGSVAVSKWFLLLFGGAALAFALSYLFLRHKRSRKDTHGPKEGLEDKTVLIATVAVAAMGWIVSLVSLLG